MRTADDDFGPAAGMMAMHAPGQQSAMRAEQLRTDIETMRQTQAAIENDGFGTASAVDDALSFDQLTETEKSAATIGANPDEWRPIGWMNQAHYTTLLKKNVIGGRLTQQIEAYKAVASAE